jgi:outer membrane protein OmpA-like peptidoglycan-associated protein
MMHRSRFVPVLALVLLVMATACAGGDDDDNAGAPSRADCSGFYLGTFGGERSGPLVARLGDDGSFTAALVGPDLFDLDITNLAGLTDFIAGIGLELGDLSLSTSGLEIAPGALAVGFDAVRLGNLEIPLAPAGSVDSGGVIEARDGDGVEITGDFEWATCTGSGEWSDGDDTGRWRAAVAAGRLSAGDCDGPIYIGIAPDLGGLDIDLDAFCLSSSVNNAELEPLDDGIERGEIDEMSVYTLEETVLFDFGSAVLTATAADTLGTVAGAIEAQRLTALTIQIIGHTDSIGSAEFNLDLSKQRAEAVRADMADRLPDATLTATGLGEANPRAPNANPDGTDNPEGRRQNRRVEIFVSGSA